MNTTLSTNFPVALTYDLFPINTEYGIMYAALVLIGLYVLIITEVSANSNINQCYFFYSYSIYQPFKYTAHDPKKKFKSFAIVFVSVKYTKICSINSALLAVCKQFKREFKAIQPQSSRLIL